MDCMPRKAAILGTGSWASAFGVGMPQPPNVIIWVTSRPPPSTSKNAW